MATLIPSSVDIGPSKRVAVRASSPVISWHEVVDGRDKPGHDGVATVPPSFLELDHQPVRTEIERETLAGWDEVHAHAAGILQPDAAAELIFGGDCACREHPYRPLKSSSLVRPNTFPCADILL